MRKNLRLISLSLLVLAILIATSFGKIEKSITKVQTFPSTVCPGSKSGNVVIDYLPKSKIKAALIPNETGKLKPLGTSVLNASKPLLVDGQEVTSMAIIKGSSGWLAATSCSISDGDDWFIGGSANITSRGYLEIVNSGLSAAQVDLKIYSKTAPRTINKTIPANSVKYVKLDSLAPGEDSIAINAITRSGRISVFMLDNRGSGLRSLGGDFVPPALAPAKSVVIPFIPTIKKGGQNTQTLRLVVPGSVDANIKATIYSGDGSFAPRGIDGQSVNGGTVKDIDINPIVSDSSYVLKIDSDVPISASIFTRSGQDFIWSTSAQPLKSTTIRLGGFKPVMRFYGQNIDLNLSWVDSNGKRSGKRITESDTVSFKSKIGLNSLTVENLNGVNYGSLKISNSSGAAILPIVSGAHLESAALPRSDARAINRN